MCVERYSEREEMEVRGLLERMEDDGGSGEMDWGRIGRE